jgi:uncharacterized protein
MKKIAVIILLLLSIPLVYSLEGAMPLLAVTQTDVGFSGSTAQLNLEIKEGTGSVFVDTFPLSKIDTQISMRFAKEIACDFLDKDCSNLDFVYIIKANSPIISGPSAGAAATVLTISVLTNTPLKNGVAMTGTINSGGLIGPVGGLKEKIQAASKAGLKTVLIPQGENTRVNATDNSSMTLKEYGKSLDVNIIDVSGLDSALEIITGKRFTIPSGNIVISNAYKQTMKTLAAELCGRNKNLSANVFYTDQTNETTSLYNSAKNLSKRGEDAFNKERFYSAASYCFGSNVKYSQAFLERKNFSEKKYNVLLDDLRNSILEFEKEIDKKQIKTITDLESYMVVKERLMEALDFTNNTDNISNSYVYAYSNERRLSAYSWAEFFKNQGKELVIDDASLKDSCTQKISETEERLQYAAIYLPFELESPREELNKAYSDFNDENYALCLFKASQAKAEANIVLNTLGIETDYLPKLIENKLNVAAQVIAKGEKNGVFPILGYSYYEYANDLKGSDKFSGLLYSEYALELSNLDIYFKEKKQQILFPQVDTNKIILVLSGILIGIIIGVSITLARYSKRNKKRIVKKHQ